MASVSPMVSIRAAFDPFQDRLCRDIRNDLSQGLMAVLRSAEIGGLDSTVARYRARSLDPVQSDYLDERLARYQRVLAEIKTAWISKDDTYGIAVLLWDQGLFFEVHEWLEAKWLVAGGPEKKLLQALIRAAGTYVHLGAGRLDGAQKMACRAVSTLTALKAMVPGVIDVDLLIAKLTVLDPVPPKFGRR